MGRVAAFLDRDGLICEDVHYMPSPEKFKLLPGVAEGIKLLNEKGVMVIVATNQSGVARGYFTEEALQKIHERMVEVLGKEGARLDAIYYCPHHPDDNCECRKPKPGMLKRAAVEHDLDLSKCFFIGDRQLDADAGRQAGCKSIVVPGPESEDNLDADHMVKDFYEAAKIVVGEI